MLINFLRRMKIVLIIVLVLSLVIPQSASAWTGARHQTITADALAYSTTFGDYVTSNNLDDDLNYYVEFADDDTEKYYVAHLDDIYPGFNIMEKSGDPDSVQHVAGTIRSSLLEDPRMYNAVACLNLSLSLKSSNPETSIRIFANGLHLLQDYFAHLNSPGAGSGGVSHGVDVMIDTDEDGIPDNYAGNYVDNYIWDCHSDTGNTLVPFNLRETDVLNAFYWHKHTEITDCWRYAASYELSIEYMQAYAVYESNAYFVEALNRGYVVNGSTTTYIDLLTRNKEIVDNTDPECTFDSAWPDSTTVVGYYGTDYKMDGTSGADSASRWAQWTPNLPRTGSYKVYMRWAAHANRPDAAPLTITYDGGVDTSKTVNQTINGNMWNYIGEYNFLAGSNGSVKITASDAGYTVADAVMFVWQPIPTITIDNSDSGCSYGGTWETSTTNAGYYGTNYSHDGTSGSDGSSKWAQWTPSISKAGTYNIYMRWAAGTNRPDAAPVTITYNGGIETKTVNQQIKGGEWVLLGTYDLSAGSGNNVKIVASDSGYTIADAVRFQPYIAVGS